MNGMGPMAKTISICIPVYNEAKNLPIAVEAVNALFQKELAEYRLEIIVTDNASSDDTWRVVQDLARAYPFLRGFRFSRNFGYQNSVFAGMHLAAGDAVVELDADLEDPPAVIPQFVSKWEEGYEVVYGVRATRHAPWIMRTLFSVFYRILNRVSDLPIPENAGDFRLLDRRVVEVLKMLPERNLYLRGLVAYVGFRQASVVYHRDPRLSGASKFRMAHYIVLAIDALTSFSKTPLRAIGVVGGWLFALSLGLSLYYLIGKLTHGLPVPGFTTLAILTLMMNSITFIFLGVIGEYLSRIFDDSKGRPRVIIAESTEGRDHPPFL